MNDAIENKFEHRILDNVHGFIYYTDTERKIIESQYFKRLQSIKQLSIANWVFPGSEHTRFIHSLGVMYLADKIASRFDCLDENERKIVRLAGLLHDIGHYPLSHVCEYPYQASLTSFPDASYCAAVNLKVKNRIDTFSLKPSVSFMERRTGLHHERVGADLIEYNSEISSLIIKECGADAPQIIADMVTGNVERKLTENQELMVQILHSELDADGIDYLMRDASFSGTSFGSFEVDQLINSMEAQDYEGLKIMCISPKGIAAADQYLINKFFSYSQVVNNKHISITEWMAEQIVDWMQKNNAYFPSPQRLKDLVDSCHTSTDKGYLDFTDNFFWASLQNILSNPLAHTTPKFILHFCRELLRHNELEYENGSEVRLISSEADEIKKELSESWTYKCLSSWTDRISIFSTRSMSKHTPSKIFEAAIEDSISRASSADGMTSSDHGPIQIDDIPQLKRRRLMEGICVADNDLHLLCDDYRSLMQVLYNQTLVILRAFKCPL